MKYLVLLLMFIAQLVASDIDSFIVALEKVESNQNTQAIGDNGRAFGILQIHAITVEDYNRIYGTNYQHEDVFNPEIARKICKGYLSHYTKHLESPNFKDFSFIWNGGPSGWKYARYETYGNPNKRANLEKFHERLKNCLTD